MKKTFYKQIFYVILQKVSRIWSWSGFRALAAVGWNEGKRRLIDMKHIKTLTTRNLKESMKKGGCGECQTSCQSACKTSCTVGNQSCEKVK